MFVKERASEREKETDRQTETERQRDTERERQTDRDRETERKRERGGGGEAGRTAGRRGERERGRGQRICAEALCCTREKTAVFTFCAE